MYKLKVTLSTMGIRTRRLQTSNNRDFISHANREQWKTWISTAIAFPWPTGRFCEEYKTAVFKHVLFISMKQTKNIFWLAVQEQVRCVPTALDIISSRLDSSYYWSTLEPDKGVQSKNLRSFSHFKPHKRQTLSHPLPTCMCRVAINTCNWHTISLFLPCIYS